MSIKKGLMLSKQIDGYRNSQLIEQNSHEIKHIKADIKLVITLS